MSEKSQYIGFDCGNSSVRTVIGTFDGSHISTEVVHQVSNKAIRCMKYDYWDILNIFSEMQKGFKTAVDAAEIRSFGISTWGIDFGCIGKAGEMLANPLCYRNPLGAIGMDSLNEQQHQRMFKNTGIQNHPMNSIYQLMGIRKEIPEYLAQAESILLIPDLLNYLFTGKMNTETSIASTMQLLDMRSRDYSEQVLQDTGFSRKLFPPIVQHAAVRGELRDELSEKFSLDRSIPAVCVPSHDTAAAVVSVPTEEQDFAFISSGTWSLIGTEIHEPIINDRVYKQGFANEGGFGKSITLLKNSAGMHILQNIKRELEFDNNRDFSWEEIIALSNASGSPESLSLFDPNDDSLYNPDSMIMALKQLTGEEEIGRLIASAYTSLAVSYTKAIEQLEMITGKPYPVIHIIGGGSRNDHVNQMTADFSGRTVIAGPDEATSLGTIAVQVLHDHPELSIADIRRIIRDSVEVQTFTPKK
ncbi:MAG: carbohydrate kinase [Spirochaetales bacterium]|nr:carbohydrate kinase [Spirochaetales bacterium]